MFTRNNWAFKKYTRGDLSDLIFLEWKYFSFISEEIEGFICYVIGNPRNVFKAGRGMVCYSFNIEGGAITGCFEVPFRKISLKGDKWTLGNAEIISISDDKWNIRGNYRDIFWNLDFKNIVPGGLMKYTGDKTFLGQRWVNWGVISNYSKTKGEVTINGKYIDLECLGYIDTNYGHWETYRNLWKWIQGVSPSHGGVGFSFGNIQNKNLKEKKSVLFLTVREKGFRFDDIELKEKFNRDRKIPGKIIVRALSKDKKIKVDLIYNIMERDLMKVKLFRFIPLVDLNLLKGKAKLHIHFLDTKEEIYIDCNASGEYPKTPLM